MPLWPPLKPSVSKRYSIRCHSNTLTINLNQINPFHATNLSLPPKKIKKIKGFLMFSWGIERDQRHKMGQVLIITV